MRSDDPRVRRHARVPVTSAGVCHERPLFLAEPPRELAVLLASTCCWSRFQRRSPLLIAVPARHLRVAPAAPERADHDVANIVQTVPSLAMFGFLLPVPLFGGVGARAAIVVLTLYGLLPILRMTIAGLKGIDRAVWKLAWRWA